MRGGVLPVHLGGLDATAHDYWTPVYDSSQDSYPTEHFSLTKPLFLTLQTLLMTQTLTEQCKVRVGDFPGGGEKCPLAIVMMIMMTWTAASAQLKDSRVYRSMLEL